MGRKTVGVVMRILLFVGMMGFGIHLVGFDKMLIALGISLAAAGYTTCAVYLIRTGGTS